jgi:hypothetical protein
VITLNANLPQDDEDALESAKKVEQTQMSEIDGDMRDVDTLKQTKAFLKTQCDKLEEEVNNVRRYEQVF